MPELSFDEIKNWRQFEELGAAYFSSLKESAASGVIDVTVQRSGIGADGAVDLLVDFLIPDFIKTVKRTWVIQFKFYSKSVSPRDIADINIPTLVHSYKACGYLLICKNSPTSKLVGHFKNLSNGCLHRYNYEIWTGEQFRQKLMVAPELLLKQFFPKYAEELSQLETRALV